MKDFNQKKKVKQLTKKIGIGALIVVPIVLILSFVFTEIGIPDGLSIFLLVLIAGIACFVYSIVLAKIEDRNAKLRESFEDPFNKSY